jgi:uncharacterized membrane protein (UPF0127 family)
LSKAPEFVSVRNLTKLTCLGGRIRVADRGLDGMIGLLGKRSLEPGSGLFIVPTQAVHTVGMSFPIDLVFVDKSYRVIGVRENVRPYRLSPLFWRALGVVELPVGAIQSSSTTVGDQLKVQDPEPAISNQ